MKKFLQKKNIGLKPLRNKPPKSPLPQTVAAIASLVITTGGILISLIETEIRCSFHLQSESCQGSIINQAEDFYREGSKLLELERNRDALNSFEQAIDLDPKQAQAKVWNKHGVASEKLGKNQQALASYEKALLIDPTYELARQNREELLLKQKQLRSQINQRE
jgi:tetratricopeptide (TPR) repeat protein